VSGLRLILPAAVLVLACAPAAWAQDQVLGLLSLPEVFGSGACDKFTPAEITLYAAPDSEPAVGSIRVDQYWTFYAAGGCEGLMVNVHRAGTGGVGELPTREYEYEAPAAIVLQRRGSWFKIRLVDGAAWLMASQRDEYFPLERLLTDGLTYLTDASDGVLASSPGVEGREALRERVVSGRPVRVVEFRQVDGRLWVHIDVMSHSICESAVDPSVTARGWLPAHAASGEPTVWFFSRGC
jgi:hypothetical protein